MVTFFRRESSAGGVAAVLLIAAFLAVIGVAVWVVVYEDDLVKVEVCLASRVDTSTDPATATVGVRITSKLDRDVMVDSYHIRIYTDASRGVKVLDESGGRILVPAKGMHEEYYDVTLHNLDEVGDSLYIVFDMVHEGEGEGTTVHDHYEDTVDLNAVWEKLSS